MAWIFLLSILVLTGAAVPGAFARDFVFETTHVRLSISENGAVTSLMQKDSRQELLGSTALPLAIVKRGEQLFPASEVRDEGTSLFRVLFGQSGVEAQYRITSRQDYMVFELVHLRQSDIQQATIVQIGTRAFSHAGSSINARWDDRFTVCLMSLDRRVEAKLGGGNTVTSSVYPEFGMDGTKTALIAVPTGKFLETVQKIEHDFGLPSPTIDGQWAKTSAGGRASYLFADLSEDNARELVDYAKLGAFGYILIPSTSWAQSLGSYPINTRNFPNGEEGLKATIAKCHAAGLRVGMHMLTSFVSKNDPLVSPVPSPWLLKSPVAKLAGDLASDSTVLVADSPISDSKGRSMDLQIDNEIVSVPTPANPSSTLAGLTRGHGGTGPRFHTRGTQVFRLITVEGGAYLADTGTPVKDRISDRIAGLINRCGFDMIYFDGGELNSTAGPFWYWGSELQASVLAKTKRELRIQGSGFNHWSWHMWTRGTCDDYVAVGTKLYLDYHKIGDVWHAYSENFMPAELGWLGLLADAPDHPATSPDEVELYAARAVALDSPLSIETTLDQLRTNGRVREMFQQLAEYERLRIGNKVSATVRERLTQGEWHLQGHDSEVTFSPIRYDSSRLDVPGDLIVKDVPRPQPLKFRLQALPSIAKTGDPSNIILGRSAMPMILGAHGAQTPMPGALAGHIDFGPKQLDLRRHRALAITLEIDGAASGATKPAVLNVQLEAGGGSLRDHYIDVDFNGTRTVIVPQPTSDRMLSEFRPAYANYSIKAALRVFNYGSVTGVSFRWMRQNLAKPVRCRVLSLESLAERDQPLGNLRISIAGAVVPIPVPLAPQNYAEYWGQGPIRILDPNGVLVHSIPMQASGPLLPPGESRGRIDAAASAPAAVTPIILGDPIPAH